MKYKINDEVRVINPTSYGFFECVGKITDVVDDVDGKDREGDLQYTVTFNGGECNYYDAEELELVEEYKDKTTDRFDEVSEEAYKSCADLEEDECTYPPNDKLKEAYQKYKHAVLPEGVSQSANLCNNLGLDYTVSETDKNDPLFYLVQQGKITLFDALKVLSKETTIQELLEDKRIMEDAKDKANKLKSSEQWIIDECEELKNTLLAKNRLYGDSCFDRGIFDIDPIIGIKCRLQDKLNRLKSAQLDDKEDVTKDILGYIILLRIAEKRK